MSEVVLKDSVARRIALREIDKTFMVEASAGSGKTSLMSGRILTMLSQGIHPKNIAAVSFTEMAAAELAARVNDTIDDVLNGTPPADLRQSYDEGNISLEGQENLRKAQAHLGDLVCTTIHGFCKHILKPYPVEANLDPGATIMDATQASLLFDDIVNKWLNQRLSGYKNDEDIITFMVTSSKSPKDAINLIKDFSSKLREYPDLNVPEVNIDFALIDELKVMCDKYREYIDQLGFEPEENYPIRDNILMIPALIEKVKNDADVSGVYSMEHKAAMAIINHSLSPSILKADGDIRVYKMKGKWQAAAPTKKEGEIANDNITQMYIDITSKYMDIKRNSASVVLKMVSQAIRPLIDMYNDEKRAGAVLDFEDLLISTRNLLINYPEIAKSIGDRYQHILVDEFQDTDPVQTDIFKHICFDKDVDGNWVPRDGAIFLVGDPKQSIYRFRGADVNTYLDMKNLLIKYNPNSILSISTNFRSSKGILDYVNDVFEEPLSKEGQPGFTPMDFFRVDGSSASISKINIPAQQYTFELRDLEASKIADICQSLIGTFPVFDKKLGTNRPCMPSDIALLAPTGAELWRYESALEERSISVATQAGKGMLQRQETQDIIAITRILADPRDTAALGAFLRGPLIGFTDNELLDASYALPKRDDGGLGFLHVEMDVTHIENPLLRSVMHKLNVLRERSIMMAPYDILSLAIEEFHVRSTIKSRHYKSPNRALANIDRFLEMSRPYAIRGLREFSDDIRAMWEDGERTAEAMPDGENDSVAIVTMHSSKGLEWPVVFLINTMTETMRSSPIVVDVSTREINMPVLNVIPQGYIEMKNKSETEIYHERVRLMYVAATRARDLFILPVYENINGQKWANVTDMKTDSIEEQVFEVDVVNQKRKRDSLVNKQDKDTFIQQNTNIIRQQSNILYLVPSRHEVGDAEIIDMSATVHSNFLDDIYAGRDVSSKYYKTKGSTQRGDITHKIIEEILTGEVEKTKENISHRAEILIQRIRDISIEEFPDIPINELTEEIYAVITSDFLSDKIDRLIPELHAYSYIGGNEEALITHGIMDAVYINEDNKIDTVYDWKTDLNPTPQTIAHYKEQMKKYMLNNDISNGKLVFVRQCEVMDITI